MRRFICVMGAVALAGCAAQHDPNISEAARAAALDPGFSDRVRHSPIAGSAGGSAARDAQARAICAARADMAGATFSGRGFGLAGAVSAGLEAGIAAERVRAACLNAYFATGVLPSL